ncbi:MAG TPA: acyl-CoA carboxylase subunit epsilon [Streptosporangiaceae bacterium]|nr:acyl-CoA carboxylase subunit epsilon [Streptosporangiaceae bacterium]
MTADDAPRPTLRVVHGNASAEQIAALTTVLAIVQARQQAESQRDVTGQGTSGQAGPRWPDRLSLLRAPHRPGRGAWLRSARSR